MDYEEQNTPSSLVRDAERLAHKASDIKFVCDDNRDVGHPILLRLTGGDVQQVEDLERYMSRPRRIRASISVMDADSFARYFLKYAGPNTTVFCSEDEYLIEAALDYHGPSEPSWCTHKLALELERTPEWRRWEQNNNRRMRQIEFAEFIEDNLVDIVEPVGAKMLEIVSNLIAHRDATVSSSVRLDNGQVQFRYEENIRGSSTSGTFSVPQEFTLGIAPFRMAPTYKVQARFRYRIGADGELSMWYTLIRPEDILKDAFKDARALVEAQISGKSPLILNASARRLVLAKEPD